MKISRILSKATGMILILAVILSIAPVAAFAAENGPYADTSGHWAENAIAQWSDYGVLKGDNGSFRPDDPITRAEMAAVLDRVMKYQSTDSPVFTDVSPSAWYYDNVRHLAAAGVVTGVGGGSFAPDRNITRAEAAVMIARAFHIADGSGETAVFPDAADIADWAADAVQGLKDAGYINGFPDGGFHPKDTITRAEAATILDNMVGLLIDAAGEHDYAGLGEAVGIVVINTDGAAVKNLKVNGGLIVAAGVGEGETYLENVEVAGGVYVEGGGEDSVYFNNCTIRELVI
ncbi:MAG: S-layer homology domain-containing protein, partial [Oscillospiraceae bacterium]|nr:S-layer homology domain-containing protein [Oscillospiraceae bacterium]